jgi:hypothetical protein
VIGSAIIDKGLPFLVLPIPRRSGRGSMVRAYAALDLEDARNRARMASAAIDRLRALGMDDQIDRVVSIATKGSDQEIASMIAAVARGKKPPVHPKSTMTIGRLADAWMSGRLPNVRRCGTYERVLRRHVVPHVGAMRLAVFSVADADALIDRLGPERVGTMVARVLHRLFTIAEWPVRAIDRSPLRLWKWRKGAT